MEALINNIKDFYKIKNRKAAIYITPFAKTKNLPELIGKFGFKSKYKDAWMFYEGVVLKFEMPENFTIKTCETIEEMKIFTGIFSQSYGGLHRMSHTEHYQKNIANVFLNHSQGHKKTKTQFTIWVF